MKDNLVELSQDEYNRLLNVAKTAALFWLFPDHHDVIKEDFHGLLEELSDLEVDVMEGIKSFMEEHPTIKSVTLTRSGLLV